MKNEKKIETKWEMKYTWRNVRDRSSWFDATQGNWNPSEPSTDGNKILIIGVQRHAQ